MDFRYAVRAAADSGHRSGRTVAEARGRVRRVSAHDYGAGGRAARAERSQVCPSLLFAACANFAGIPIFQSCEQ